MRWWPKEKQATTIPTPPSGTNPNFHNRVVGEEIRSDNNKHPYLPSPSSLIWPMSHRPSDTQTDPQPDSQHLKRLHASLRRKYMSELLPVSKFGPLDRVAHLTRASAEGRMSLCGCAPQSGCPQSSCIESDIFPYRIIHIRVVTRTNVHVERFRVTLSLQSNDCIFDPWARIDQVCDMQMKLIEWRSNNRRICLFLFWYWKRSINEHAVAYRGGQRGRVAPGGTSEGAALRRKC